MTQNTARFGSCFGTYFALAIASFQLLAMYLPLRLSQSKNRPMNVCFQ